MPQNTQNPSSLSSWYDENYAPLDHSKEAEKALADLHDFLKTPSGKKIRSQMRKKMVSFTISSAYKPAGSSYVNILGTYTCGSSVKNKEDTTKIAQRYKGMEMWAEACVEGYNEAAMAMKFQHRDDENYDDYQQACLAIEGESVGKKGPFDGGGKDIAVSVSNAALEACSKAKDPYDGFKEHFSVHQERRKREYKGYVAGDFKFQPENYVAHMQAKHLARTMRGFPFLKAGNASIAEEEVDTFKWQFNNDTIANIAVPVPFEKLVINEKDQQGKPTTRKMTVDEFLQMVMCNLKSAGIKMSQWFNLRFQIIIPISRDQGSPFKTAWKGNKLTLTKQGDRKYRIVTPMPALTQAWSIVATIDLVNAAPKTEGRIGLQSPDINDQRTKEFILRAGKLGQVLIPTDFSTYDQMLPGWQMQGNCCMYADMYKDEWIQDSMCMAGVAACQKLLFLPTEKTEVGKPYSKFVHSYFNEIKGDVNYARRLTLRGMKTSRARKELEKLIEFDYDWLCCCFYIYKSYLPSGFILTNTLGSDCTLAMGRTLVPLLFSTHLRDKLLDKGVTEEMIQKTAETEIVGTGSGDDLEQGVLREIYDAIGYQGVLEVLEICFDFLSMVVNPKKQMNIKYKGLPLYDFLQHVYPQGESADIEEYLDHAYLKFCRQWPNMPYTERFKKLNFILQWCIPYGKLESCLCEQNVEFASRVASYMGKHLHSAAVKNKYKPLVPISLWSDRTKLIWNNKFIPLTSEYAGFEQFIGLVKQYGQEFLPELVKYSIARPDTEVEELVESFEQELETRAPHREELARILFSAIDEKTKAKMGLETYETKSNGSTHVSLIPKFGQLWEQTTGVVVNSVKLDKPSIGAEVQDQNIPDVEEDDAEGLDVNTVDD